MGRLVTFRYTDGRLPRSRLVTVGAARAAEIISSGVAEYVDDEGRLALEAFGGSGAVVGSIETAVTIDPENETQTTTEDRSTWPPGASFTKSGSYYTFQDGTKVNGLANAIAEAWAIRDAATEPSNDSEDAPG